PKESGELPRDHLGVHFVRVRNERHAVTLPYAVEQLLDSRHRPVKEIGPDPVEVPDRTAVAGALANEFVELVEIDRAALQIAIGARLLEQTDQLIARGRGVGADVLQHPLVSELDDGVAEVEVEQS